MFATLELRHYWSRRSSPPAQGGHGKGHVDHTDPVLASRWVVEVHIRQGQMQPAVAIGLVSVRSPDADIFTYSAICLCCCAENDTCEKFLAVALYVH